jgi:hypothetical protein
MTLAFVGAIVLFLIVAYGLYNPNVGEISINLIGLGIGAVLILFLFSLLLYFTENPTPIYLNMQIPSFFK